MAHGQLDQPLDRVVAILRAQRQATTAFSVGILVLGLFMLFGAYGIWFLREERDIAGIIMTVICLLSGVGMTAAGLYGILRRKDSFENDPLYAIASKSPGSVHTMVLTTTSDSETNWYLHVFAVGSDAPIRSLEFSHSNQARKAATELQQVFRSATFSEYITE